MDGKGLTREDGEVMAFRQSYLPLVIRRTHKPCLTKYFECQAHNHTGVSNHFTGWEWSTYLECGTEVSTEIGFYNK